VTGVRPNHKIVLIADDDLAIRLLVSATLVSERYSVLEAADGEEAWRLIRQYHPAVAILDWEMPATRASSSLPSSKATRCSAT
jgi:CheY-like chemotaxis protein